MTTNQRENQYNALCAHLGLVGGVTSVKFKCPCHGDKKASGVASKGSDGRVLLKCHGCDADYADILTALGFKKEDAFPPDQDKQPRKPKSKKEHFPVVAVYDYRDANGNLFAQKLRRSNKDMHWRRPDGKGGYIYKGIPVPDFVYRLQEVLRADNWVFVVEGEKDADNLAGEGFVATTGGGGAGKGKWKTSYSECLRGKHCIVIGDHDAEGRAYAIETANALLGVAASVRVPDLASVWPEIPHKGDFSDMAVALGMDEALSRLVDLIHDTPEWEPGLTPAADQPQSDTKKDYSGEHISIGVVKAALHDLGITVRYDVLLKDTEVRGLPEYYSPGKATNILPVYLSDYLKSCGVKGASRKTIEGYLFCIADESRFNLVEELLQSVKWDGVDRLSQIYSILGVTEPKHQTYIKKWLIQCVALGLNDEESPIGAEGVLVLQGEQGLAKTSFFRIITPSPRWFCEGAVIDVAVKDTLLKALGAWITELGELDSTLKREQSALKAFITSPEDRIRIPYDVNATRAARRTSFCGTVNPSNYLRDETGSRRFWTVPVTSVDKKTLFSLPKTWPNQLWAQVYKLYLENPNAFRLTDGEMKQLQDDNRSFSVPLPFEIEIRELLNYSLPVDRWRWCRAKDVKEYLPTSASAEKVGKALKRIVEDNSTVPHCTPLKNPRLKDGTNEYFIPLKQYNQPSVWKSGAEVG